MKIASTKDYQSKVLGCVSYDGCTMTYTAVGHIRVITCRAGTQSWEVASNLFEDTDKIWRDIRAEAKAA